MTQSISVKFEKDVISRLANLSRVTGKTRSYYIRKAVDENLENMELFYIAQERANNLKNGTTLTILWDDLKKENGL